MGWVIYRVVCSPARMVFCMSVAMVMEPTPPGLGVIRPAMGWTEEKSTSPSGIGLDFLGDCPTINKVGQGHQGTVSKVSILMTGTLGHLSSSSSSPLTITRAP